MHYDSRRDLRCAIEREVGKLPDVTWNMAEPEHIPPYGDGDFDEVLSFLPRGAKTPISSSNPSRDAHRQAILEARKRALGAAELVRAVRQVFWRRPEAPFQDNESLFLWARQRMEEQHPLEPPDAWLHLWLRSDDAWVEQGLLDATGGQWSPLREAREGADILGRELNCGPDEAALHVLTGTPVVVPPVTATLLPNPDPTLPPRVSLTINFAWVPVTVVDDYYRICTKVARGEGKRSRPSPLAAEADLFLLEHKGWSEEDKRREWNRTHPSHSYDTIDALNALASKGRRYKS